MSSDERGGAFFGNKRQRRLALGLVAAGALVRIGLALLALRSPSSLRFPDDYLGIARGWIATGRLEEVVFPPLYPALCATAALVSNDWAVETIVALQLIFALATLLVAWRLAVTVDLPEPAPLVALGLVAFDPLLAISAPLVLSETTYVLLLLLSLLALVSGLERGSRGRIVFAGLGLAVAILTRSVGLVALPVFVGVALAASLSALRRTATVGLLLLGLAPPLLGWSARNFLSRGAFRPTAAAGLDFALLVVGPARDRVEGGSGQASTELWNDEVGVERLRKNPFEAEADYSKAALRWARQHPMEVARSIGVAQLRAIVAPWRSAWNRVVGLGAATPIANGGATLAAALRFATLLASIVGAIELFRKRRWRLLALLTGLPLLHLAATGGAAYGRFAVPAAPFLDLLAAVGFVVLYSRARSRASARTTPSGAGPSGA